LDINSIQFNSICIGKIDKQCLWPLTSNTSLMAKNMTYIHTYIQHTCTRAKRDSYRIKVEIDVSCFFIASLVYLDILVIARHGLSRFVNIYWCALLRHAFTYKLYGSCNLWGSVACSHTRARTRTLAHACTRCNVWSFVVCANQI
jgi:hypothetical protein